MLNWKNSKTKTMCINAIFLLLLSATIFIKILPEAKQKLPLKQLNKIMYVSDVQINLIIFAFVLLALLATMLILYNFLLTAYKILNLNYTKVRLNIYSVVILVINVAISVIISLHQWYVQIIPPICGFMMFLNLLFKDLKIAKISLNKKVILVIISYFIIFVASNWIFLLKF